MGAPENDIVSASHDPEIVRREERSRMRTWEWAALSLALFVGAALRIAYLHEFSQGPYIDYVAIKPDPAFHDDAARAMLGLYDSENPNGHGPGQPADAPYLHPPGIIFFLAATYALTGPVLWHAYAAQMALGLVNCVLAFLLARALFGRGPGAITAIVMATYWGLIYYECELHAVVLLVFLLLLLMHAMRWWLTRDTWVRAFGAGLVLALVVLTQSVVVTFAPVAASWMAYVGWRRGLGRRALLAPALLAAGTIAGVAPVTVRNYVASHEFTLVSTWGGLNLYIGNNPKATGLFMMPDALGEPESMYAFDEIVHRFGEQMGKPWTYASGNRYLAKKALAYMVSHPWATAKITVKKALMFWGPIELTHNYASVHYDREYSKVLRAIPMNFSMILAAFLLGLAFVAQRGGFRLRAKNPPDQARAALLGFVGLFVLTYSCSYIPFFVVSQFRSPLLPFLMMFGAYALWRGMLFVRSRRYRRAAATAGAGCVLYAACAFQIVPYDLAFEQRLWHYVRFLARLDQYLGAGQYDKAMAERQRASRGIVHEYGDYVAMAKRLALHGMHEEALRECESAIQTNPAWTWAYYELGEALARESSPQSRENARRHPDRWKVDRAALRELALQCHRRFTELEPRVPAGYLALGKALAAGGDVAGAEQTFRKALDLDPENRFAQEALAALPGRQPSSEDAP